jgi:hypothetical protein
MLPGPGSIRRPDGVAPIISKTTLSVAIMSRSSYVQVCSRATISRAVSQIVPQIVRGNDAHEASI